MAEKILNTRIQLKYDTIGNWTDKANEKVLKAGEVAVVEVPSSTTTDQYGHVITTEPTLLFKVGGAKYTAEDAAAGKGTAGELKKFKDLPWTSALAADVHAWAKKEWNAFINDVKAAVATGNASLVTAEAFDTFKTTVIGTVSDELTSTTIFGKIAELEDIADAADELSKDNKEILDVLNGDVNKTGSVKQQVKAIKDLIDGTGGLSGQLDILAGDFNTYVTTTAPETYAPISVVDDKADVGASYLKSETYNTGEVDSLVNGVKDLITGTDGLDARVDVLEAFKTNTAATKTDVETTKTTLIGKPASGKVEDAVATAETIYGAKAYATSEAERVKKEILTGDDTGSIAEAYDTIKEIADWIAADNTGAADIIADHESRIDNLETGIANVYTKDQVDDLIEVLPTQDTNTTYTFAVPAKDTTNNTHVGVFTVKSSEDAQATPYDTGVKEYVDGIADDLDSRVEALEQIDHTHTNLTLLETYDQTNANIKDAVEKRHSHTNMTVLNGIDADKVATWNTGAATAATNAGDIDKLEARADAIETNYIRTEAKDKSKPDELTMYLGKSEVTLVISGGSASDVW